MVLLPTSFQPGLFEQDLVTIPLEAGLIYAMNAYYTPSADPLWPFKGETTEGEKRSSRHPRSKASLFGAATVGGIGAYLWIDGTPFAYGPYARGFIHAHLLTEIATSFAKTSFQRERPFHDTEVREATSRTDSRFSFFSGHASHAFAFATYTSQLVYHFSNGIFGKYVLPPLLYAGAAIVGSARAVDGQHHWMDVGVGALAGTTISYFTFQRVREVVDANQLTQKKLHLEWFPVYRVESSGERMLGAYVRARF